jgi:hypothetical protein
MIPRANTQKELSVRLVRFRDGERFPLLIDGKSGKPLYKPTVFTLTKVRSANRASNTIDQVLRAIMVYEIFARSEKIDLDERMNDGQLLSLGELDRLANLCRVKLRQLNVLLNAESSKP